jgi:hypothetical protein
MELLDSSNSEIWEIGKKEFGKQCILLRDISFRFCSPYNRPCQSRSRVVECLLLTFQR